MPKKSVKHIPKHIPPVGTVKAGRIKVIDGDTGREVWRQGTTGMSRDWDGDAISHDYNAGKMKSKPRHKPHSGKKRVKPRR